LLQATVALGAVLGSVRLGSSLQLARRVRGRLGGRGRVGLQWLRAPAAGRHVTSGRLGLGPIMRCEF